MLSDPTMPRIARKHYAHSLAGRPEEEWQLLDDHLNATAELAGNFAASFAQGYGQLAGLWHDAGKYQKEFQDYIRRDPEAHVSGRVDHSTVGALIAVDRKSPLLGFVIAGHHGGLPNAGDLGARLREKNGLLPNARAAGLPQWLEELKVPPPPRWLEADRLLMSLWTRFVFSALVDADFLDTERFYAGGEERYLGAYPSLEELKLRLDTYLDLEFADASPTAVNEMRGRVLDACRKAAGSDAGAFTLTVPTGGGKTLASLAFALKHAVQHGLSRVIVVIPYTSIIEQTAQRYRYALGNDAVLEHHSNVDPDKESSANRLASENWDAPVVVTTSVQFFESLYANRTSRCRKLHRIARSVVIFDEVQTFPADLLSPVKHVLRELVLHYGVTTVLCTATQPVLLEGAREIIPEPEKDFASVAERCEVLMPRSEEPSNWESLASTMQTHRQALTIVHRRDDAQRLAELVGSDCLHLSARMCAAHRSNVLAEATRRLRNGEPCLLVATQLVEAGVDIDFPEVYRAFGGADSLAQAAGRCNREGKDRGRLHVFFAPTKPPWGILRTGESVARKMWREGSLDLTSPRTFTDYFAELYVLVEQDSRKVMAAEREQRFGDVADLFRMIPESGAQVVAPYGDWEKRVADIRGSGISRKGMRRLQRFLVGLYRQEIEELLKAGALERIEETFWVVVPGFRVYSERWGFGWQGGVAPEPESLIA
jgi:CRISPR-associated endonuclease/helicase Cas3